VTGATLFHWCVIELEVGSRVIVGVRTGRRIGEVSGLLASFCPSSRAATTTDGETFYLGGALDSNLQARANWMRWLEESGFEGLADVSQQYSAAMRVGLQ
jgi:hypothetical protein